MVIIILKLFIMKNLKINLKNLNDDINILINGYINNRVHGLGDKLDCLIDLHGFAEALLGVVEVLQEEERKEWNKKSVLECMINKIEIQKAIYNEFIS